MVESRGHGGWFIALTVVLALLLAVYPLPLWARWLRPDWVVLVLCYWMIATPHRVGVGWAWLAGLLLDVVESSMLGQNAFALAVVAYIAQVSYQRLRMFSYQRQALVIFLFVTLHLLLYQWVQNLLGVADLSLMMALQALLSALLWPLLSALLTRLQRAFAVA